MDAFWRPKSAQDRPKSRLETNFLQKGRFFKKRAPPRARVRFWPSGGPKMRPRSAQDRPKTVLRRVQKGIVLKDDFMIDFGSSWALSWCPLGPSWALRVPSWVRLGALLGSQDGPKIDSWPGVIYHSVGLGPSTAFKTVPGPPKTAQDAQKTPQSAPKSPQDDPK